MPEIINGQPSAASIQEYMDVDEIVTALNSAHRSSDEIATALNTTHRGSDGSNHSKVGANETAIGLNTTHRGSDGSDHSKVSANENAIAANAAAIAAGALGDVTISVDSDGQTLVKDHSYKAQSSGYVAAYTVGLYSARALLGTTDNPVVDGVVVGYTVEIHSASAIRSCSFFVGKNKYFEFDGSGTPYITWTPLISGGAAPIDQD